VGEVSPGHAEHGHDAIRGSDGVHGDLVMTRLDACRAPSPTPTVTKANKEGGYERSLHVILSTATMRCEGKMGSMVAVLMTRLDSCRVPSPTPTVTTTSEKRGYERSPLIMVVTSMMRYDGHMWSMVTVVMTRIDSCRRAVTDTESDHEQWEEKGLSTSC
jgi:hypothetical protein